jgi:hypothetical protein
MCIRKFCLSNKYLSESLGHKDVSSSCSFIASSAWQCDINYPAYLASIETLYYDYEKLHTLYPSRGIGKGLQSG